MVPCAITNLCKSVSLISKINFSLSWIWRWSDVDNSTWKWCFNGKKSRFKFSSFQFRYGSQCCGKCFGRFRKFTSVRIFNSSTFKVSSCLYSALWLIFYESCLYKIHQRATIATSRTAWFGCVLGRSWSEPWAILNDSFIYGGTQN